MIFINDGFVPNITINRYPRFRTPLYVNLNESIYNSQGTQGPRGYKGDKGDPGLGIPSGGTTGQFLSKSSNNNFEVTWSNGGGSGEILTGNVLWVDKINGNNATCEIGRQDLPCFTIAHAISEWESGVTIYVRPGVYNEQIELSGGMVFYFEPGAIVNYTGSGATFVTNSNPGQVKIQGSGRFYKTGLQATQYVFEVGDEAETEMHWHIDVNAEDVRCTVGRTMEGGHGLEAVGTGFYDEADRLQFVPFQIGEVGYQVDNKTHWIAVGATANDWVPLNAAALKVNSGYVKIKGHSLDGLNCPAVRWLSGSIDVQNERTTASGLGICTLDIGTTNPQSPNLNQFWLNTLKLQSDQNELAVYIHDETTNPVGGNVLYITSQGIYGGVKDVSNGIAIYIFAQLILPTYDSGFSTSLPYLMDFSGPNSFCSINIGDVVGATSSGVLIQSISYLLYGKFSRMEPFGGISLQIGSGTAYIHVLNSNGQLLNVSGILEVNGLDIPPLPNSSTQKTISFQTDKSSGSVTFICGSTSGYYWVKWWDNSLQFYSTGSLASKIASGSGTKEVVIWPGELTPSVFGLIETFESNNNSLISLTTALCTSLQNVALANESLLNAFTGQESLISVNISNCDSISSINLTGAISPNLSDISITNNSSLTSLNVSNCDSLRAIVCTGNSSLTTIRAVSCLFTSGNTTTTTTTTTQPPNTNIVNESSIADNNLNAAALNQFYSDLESTIGTITTVPIDYGYIEVSDNPGTGSDNTSIASAKGYVIIGS